MQGSWNGVTTATTVVAALGVVHADSWPEHSVHEGFLLLNAASLLKCLFEIVLRVLASVSSLTTVGFAHAEV